MKTKTTLAISLLTTVGILNLAAAQTTAQERRIPVSFVGGYDTDRRDGGRPVVLIAAALGVPTEVFRRAFSGVTPARGRAPEPEQVRRNKEALLAVLGPYGITNDRLDTVSNYYRYSRERGEMWRNTPAEAYAVVSKGKLVAIKVTNPGSGYSSIPRIAIPGFDDVPVIVTVTYTKRFETNGAITAVVVAPRH